MGLDREFEKACEAIRFLLGSFHDFRGVHTAISWGGCQVREG